MYSDTFTLELSFQTFYSTLKAKWNSRLSYNTFILIPNYYFTFLYSFLQIDRDSDRM